MVLGVDAFWNAPKCFWAALEFFKRKQELGPGFTEPVPPDKVQTVEIMLQGSGAKKSRVTIYWDLTMQHTISWKEPITALVQGVATTLKPGSCNLYTFPKVTWEKPRVTSKASIFQVVRGAEAAAAKASETLVFPHLSVLREIFLAIARDHRERGVRRRRRLPHHPLLPLLPSHPRRRRGAAAALHSAGLCSSLLMRKHATLLRLSLPLSLSLLLLPLLPFFDPPVAGIAATGLVGCEFGARHARRQHQGGRRPRH
jgi:hypothetical protein